MKRKKKKEMKKMKFIDTIDVNYSRASLLFPLTRYASI